MAVNFSSQEKQIVYENRFCSQEHFEIIISGKQYDLGNNEVRSTFRISYPEFKEIEVLQSSSINRTETEKTICERSNIWIICSNEVLHYTNKIIKGISIDSFSKYFYKNDQWIKLIQLPDSRTYFYACCSFMKSLYVFGGYNLGSLKSCLKYDTTTSKWTNIVNMNDRRGHSACTVFEGKIVVTGGYDHVNGKLNSVESYDHHKNEWTYFPAMIDKRWCHGSVSMGNKMFVIGGWGNLTCEVFDSSTRQFTSIKNMLVLNHLINFGTSVVNIGYKVLFFYSTSCNANNKFQVYDVLKDQWSFKENNLIEGKRRISCSKLPLV